MFHCLFLCRALAFPCRSHCQPLLTAFPLLCPRPILDLVTASACRSHHPVQAFAAFRRRGNIWQRQCLSQEGTGSAGERQCLSHPSSGDRRLHTASHTAWCCCPRLPFNGFPLPFLDLSPPFIVVLLSKALARPPDWPPPNPDPPPYSQGARSCATK